VKANYSKTVKSLFFFWSTSALLAIGVYYILWLIMPSHRVFGAFFHMNLYHYRYPVPYILIVCFFYGIVATLFTDRFVRQTQLRQIITTLIIVILTVLISSPFGGMLWHYHDMQAGFFPGDWKRKMVKNGIRDGLSIGWFIIAISIPYNIIGILICYYLTRKGAFLLREKPNKSNKTV